jgi:hypothetical protein
MRRIFLLSSSALILVLLVTLGVSYRAIDQISTKINSQENRKTLGVETEKAEFQVPYVTLKIDAGEGISSSYILNTEEGQTAFSLLEKAEKLDEIVIETTEYEFGIFVDSINGFESSEDLAWIYFVNGQSGNVAADQYFLNPGDIVEWKYIEPTF